MSIAYENNKMHNTLKVMLRLYQEINISAIKVIRIRKNQILAVKLVLLSGGVKKNSYLTR